VGDAKGNVKALEIVKTRLGEYDTSGRRKPVLTDEVQRIECDSVVLAVGETVDMDFCKASGLQVNANGTIEVDRYKLETSRPRFFAGGDLVTGASNVSNAMAFGKRAARAIDEQLMDAQRWDSLLPAWDFDQLPPKDVSDSRRHHARELAVRERMQSSIEVVTGLSAEETHEEACRCLRCDIKVVASR